MKPARFKYRRIHDLGEALRLLEDGGADARALAGGQSLVPAMNLRLARPTLLVDLNRIPGLRGLRATEDGTVIAGALTRHSDFEFSDLVAQRLPILRAAMARFTGNKSRVAEELGLTRVGLRMKLERLGIS